MRRILIILTAFLLIQTSRSVAQTVTFSGKNVELKKVFAAIKQQTGYMLLGNTELLKNAKPVSLDIRNMPLANALEVILKDQPFNYTIGKKTILLSKKNDSPVSVDLKSTSSENLIDVHGRIINEKGEPVTATITVKGTKRATGTNANGEFQLTGVPENANLVITGITIETLELKSNTDLQHVVVKTKIKEEETVVVANTGYQKVKPNEVNGSMTVIDNKTLNLQTGTNIIDRLNGVTPSMIFLSGKISPGGFSYIPYTIRGLSTINSNPNPLIVLDNFPYEGNIENINPFDVASITILKDAAATSIYGARGGNGVIVITTKSEKFNQKTKVNLAYNTTIASKPNLYVVPQISSADYIDVEAYLFKQGYIFSSNKYSALTPAVEIFLKGSQKQLSSADSAAQIEALKKIDYREDLNNYFFQPAITSQYSFNINGGSNNIGWFLSGNYDKVVSNLNAPSDRFTLNFKNSYKPLKKLQLSLDSRYANSKQITGKQLPSRVRNAPYIDLVDDEGNSLAVPTNADNSVSLRSSFTDTAGSGELLDWHYYPLEDYKHDVTTIQSEEILVSVIANWELLKGLNLMSGYQWRKEWSNSERYADEKSFFARNLINLYTNLDLPFEERYPIPIGGIGRILNRSNKSQVARLSLSFNRSWNTNHFISALAGMDVSETIIMPEIAATFYGYDKEKGSSKPVDYKKTDFPVFGGINAPNEIPGRSSVGYKAINEQVSFYGNFSYIYKARYTLSVSGRKDASNTFGLSTNDKWKPLWSAGLGWDVSKESFYHVTTIPRLKLKATWGYSGNISPNKTALPTIASAVTNTLGLAQSFINNLPDPRLRWEKSRHLNIALEFSLKKLVSGSIEYYQKNNTDLYATASIDYTSGFTQSPKNSANTKNEGIEVSLNMAKQWKDVKWNITLLYNYQVDKLIKYDFAQFIIPGDGNSFSTQFPTIGKPLFSINALRWRGLNSNGMPQGYLNGKLSTSYNEIFNENKGFSGSSLKYIGQSIAPHFGSVVNQFSYKGVNFSFIILYQFGHYFRKPAFSSQNASNGDIHPDYSKRWKKPGDELITNVPGFVYPDISGGYADRFYQQSEVNVLKADNIRLQGDIGLSYSIMPNRKRIFEQLQVRLAMGGLNGAIWVANKEGLDPISPDQKAGLFSNKSFSIGLTANF